MALEKTLAGAIVGLRIPGNKKGILFRIPRRCEEQRRS